MLAYKGFVLRWYAVITQLVPSMKAKIMPVLQKSAEAAIAQCTGGAFGRQCGIRWNTGKYDGKTGASQEMSALSAVLSLQMVKAKEPVTEGTGGTSKGNAGGGTDGGGSPLKKEKSMTIGDNVGAGFATLLLLGLACGMFGWVTMDSA